MPVADSAELFQQVHAVGLSERRGDRASIGGPGFVALRPGISHEAGGLYAGAQTGAQTGVFEHGCSVTGELGTSFHIMDSFGNAYAVRVHQRATDASSYAEAASIVKGGGRSRGKPANFAGGPHWKPGHGSAWSDICPSGKASMILESDEELGGVTGGD